MEEASTYNLNNDVIVKDEVSQKEALTERVNAYGHRLKFNLNNVKEGSIIHYRCKIYVPFVSLPDWYFQDRYPKLYSEFEVLLQHELESTAIMRTSVPITTVKNEKN